MKRNVQQMVTGIVVNEKMQVSRRERQNLRLEIYYVEKFGLANHAKAIKNKKDNYAHHLLGRINYFLMLNPDDKEFIAYKKMIRERYFTENITES